MKRKTISRMLALLLTACLCLSLGAAAFADEGDGLITDPDTGAVTNPAGITYPSNEGSIDKNEGTIIVNTAPTDTNPEGGLIGENTGTVGDVQNPTDANQGNAGTIYENSGTVTLNSGVIGTNTEGSIETNTGTVGWIGVKETGEVWVEGGGNEGHIDTNSGTVVINTGDIDQNTASGTVGVLDQNNTPVEGTGNFGNIDTNKGTVTFNAGAGDLPESEPEAVVIGEGGGESGADPTESDYTGATIGTNEGTVLVNNGLIGTNSGVIDTNTGTVVDNLESGTVKENAAPTEDDEDGGNIGTNSGKVEENNGTVTTNKTGGEIIENNGLVETNSGVIDTNSGTVGLVANEAGNPVKGTGNFGEIDTNSGTVVYNDGDATIGANTGTVHDNFGTVEENSGKVDYNRGTVEENSGTVIYNDGTIGSLDDETGKMESGNIGKVSRNGEAGVMLNLKGGTVNENMGEVYNYGGEVQAGLGTEYFSVEIVNTTTYTKDESSGLKEAYGQQWLGQTGRTQTTATVILTPAEGYKITLIAGLSDNVKAQRNDDGTWTLTIKSGSNITINVPEATEINAKPQPIPDPDPDPDPDPNPAPAPLPAPAPAPDPQPASDPQPGPSRQDNLFVITYGDGSQVAYNFNVDSISATATEPAPAAPITPPAKTERTVKGTVDHATHLEKVDDVVHQLEGNTLTALQNGNAAFAAAFDIKNASMLASGVVNFKGAYDEAEEDVILVPSESRVYFVNNTYTVVLSDGTVLEVKCTDNGVLDIPFPKDAAGMGFVVLLGGIENNPPLKPAKLATEAFSATGYNSQWSSAYINAYINALAAGKVGPEADAAAKAALTDQMLRTDIAEMESAVNVLEIQVNNDEVFKNIYISLRLAGYPPMIALDGADDIISQNIGEARSNADRYQYTGEQKDLYIRVYLELIAKGVDKTKASQDAQQSAANANAAGTTTEATSAAGGPAADPDIIRDNDALLDAAIKSALEDARNARQTNNANAAGTTTEATSAAGGDAAHPGSFDDDDLAALDADALNSILENDQNARNAQQSAATANAAGTTGAASAANAYAPDHSGHRITGDHSGALGD